MEDAINILQETDKVLQLGEKGLARTTEVSEIEKKIRIFLHDNLDPDAEIGREYEKWSRTGTWYRTLPRNGFADESYITPVQILRSFLTKFLDANNVITPPTQKYIKTGEVFTGRRILRDILSNAKKKIDIQDNYIDLDVLAILQPYLENNSILELRLLTGEQVKKDFLSDFSLFAKQFGKVSGKKHDKVHGRFIILDGQEVFSVGHSLKDLGKKADIISKIEDQLAMKDTIEDFEHWWNEAENLLSNK